MYESKAKTTKISATSRSAIKIRESYYTVEATEERSLPEYVEGIDLNAEWELLWASVNTVVDNQVEEIVKTFK